MAGDEREARALFSLPPIFSGGREAGHPPLKQGLKKVSVGKRVLGR